MHRRDTLDRFYDLIEVLEVRCGGRRLLADCDGSLSWPKRGVYFFFEPGEFRADGVVPRVVRVGTHALRPSASTLWGRLAQHRGSQAGRFPGGGNHRGSVFRLHVGTALLGIEKWPSSIDETWAVGGTADTEIRMNEHPLECAVSERIGRMPFLWMYVDDPPDRSSDRGIIERGSIALLSNYSRVPIDPPSSEWLGRWAAADGVRRSGLWNVNHVQEPVSDRFLSVMEAWVSMV